MSNHIYSKHCIFMFSNHSDWQCSDCAQLVTQEDINKFGELVEVPYWEGEDLQCEGCNKIIESAYGVSDNE